MGGSKKCPSNGPYLKTEFVGDADDTWDRSDEEDDGREEVTNFDVEQEEMNSRRVSADRLRDLSPNRSVNSTP